MKFADMNERQKKAYINVYWAANDLTGGLENAISDYPEDSEDYKQAYNELHDHDLLVEHLYEMATTAIYGEGFCCFDKRTCERQLRDINFCGKSWIMERCEKRITKLGY